MKVNRINVRIAWGDCDPAGIVFYPRYLAMFNEAASALFESAGYPKPLLLKTYGIIGFPVVEISGSFTRPCSFGEDVIIETGIEEWGRSSFRVHHRLFKGGELAVDYHEKRVWAVRDPGNSAGIRGQAIPEELKALLSDPPASRTPAG
jgi:4-hydroxybenzoyl-CoA thioesterase